MPDLATPDTAPDTTTEPEFKDQDQQQPQADAPKAADKNPYSSPDTTGYGPIEGTRWLKDRVQQEFAAMSVTSDNPGMYVRQQFDLNKKIDGFGQNLTLEDANHVYENVFSPEFDKLKVNQVQGDYDSRGQKLLDQIYAPLGHGSTKPRWDQIPKDERIASAAYAVVSALRGKGAEALSMLSRPLTAQEQENVKKENEAQQNEQLRRQGLVEQFNVLMGNKKAETAAMEQRQREDAISRRSESKQDFEQRKFDQQQATARSKQQDLDSQRVHQRWAKSRDSGADSTQKQAALSDYEDEMRQVTGDPNWKASPEDYKAATTKSSYEQTRESITALRQQRKDYLAKTAVSNIAYFQSRAKHEGLMNEDLEYRVKHLLPDQDENLQKRTANLELEGEKLNDAKLHGWIKTAKDSTLLRDAGGNLILDVGGHPIRTLGEARMKVSERDTYIRQTASELQNDVIDANIPQDIWNGIHGVISSGLRHGMSAEKIEAQVLGFGVDELVRGVPGAGVNKELISREIALESARQSNEKLREKLGGAQQTPEHGEPAATTSDPPSHPKAGDTWTHPSGAKMVFGKGPKGVGWYNAANYGH